MSREEINNYANIIYEYILKQPDGYRTTTSRVIKRLGLNTDGFDDDWNIHNELFNVTEKDGRIFLDMSEHDGMCEGLPMNLDYVVKKIF